MLGTLPITREGLTQFTFSRFLVPWLCGYEGWAVFLDADELVLHDISDLMELADERYAAMVVKHEFPRKYEWPSVMLFNCARCTMLTPETVERDGLFGFDWADEVGALPAEWNHLVGYDPPRQDAKLVHFTQGVPCFPEVEGCEYAKEWKAAFRSMVSSEPWEKVMGASIHAAPVRARLAMTTQAQV